MFITSIAFEILQTIVLPVLTSHNLTVPSSEEVITNLLLNCKHVTAELCLFDPVHNKIEMIKITRLNVTQFDMFTR